MQLNTFKKMLLVILSLVLFVTSGCTVRIYYVSIYKNPDSEVLFDIDVKADVPHSTNVTTEGELDIDPALIP